MIRNATLTAITMSLDPSYYYFQSEGFFGSFVISKVLFPKFSWAMICEFMHHLLYHQCTVQAILTQNSKKCAQFCSGGITTYLTLELDVCQVVLSPGAMRRLRCSVGSFTSDLHSLEVPPFRFASHRLYASWWITPIPLCVFMNRTFPFHSHPT